MSGTPRAALPTTEKVPKPRISAPLDRTKSVLATPIMKKLPMAESTPAPKPSFDSIKNESTNSSFFGAATATPPVQPVAQSTFIVSVNFDLF